MKATLIHASCWASDYYCSSMDVAKSGRTIGHTVGQGYRRKVSSFSWGRATKALWAEAQALNAAQKELDTRRRAFDAKLTATQPAVLAAAAKAPDEPKVAPVPLPPLNLDDLV